jgi:CheY-like chemotaxis protein
MAMNSRLFPILPPGVLAAMPNDSKPIVLVADDEPSMVAMLSSHLRSKGFSVLEASDGDQAWELAHEHLPNLVLLDVMMP